MPRTPVFSRPGFALAFLLTVPVLSLAIAQTVGPYNEIEARRLANVQDSNQVVLDFSFKAPRLLTVNIPGRGKRIAWEHAGTRLSIAPRSREALVPDFELVTLDNRTIHHDQVLPKAEEAIRRIEDPTRFLDIKNSVTIQSRPIPITKPDSGKRAVTGVAMDDVLCLASPTRPVSAFLSPGCPTAGRRTTRERCGGKRFS